MTRVRQLLYPLWYVGVRLAARPGRIALVVVGIAAAAALLAGVLAGALVAQDRALAHRLDRLSPAERGLRAAWFGAPRQGGDFPTLNRAVEDAFADLGAGEPVRAMQYKQTRIDGKLVDLGAVDGLERWVRLRSGRLPHPCRPERCEVVQLGGSGSIPNVPGLPLVRVGRGTLASEVPFGRLAPTSAGGLVETVGARFAVETRAPPSSSRRESPASPVPLSWRPSSAVTPGLRRSNRALFGRGRSIATLPRSPARARGSRRPRSSST